VVGREREQAVERGEKMVDQGQWFIQYGKDLVTRGKRLVKSGQQPMEERHGCHVCGAVFSDSYHLGRHTLAMHAVKENGVACTKDYCTRIFDSVYEMVEHRQGCRFECGACGWSTSRTGRGLGHLRRCTGRP
jgi:hypothetical protein